MVFDFPKEMFSSSYISFSYLMIHIDNNTGVSFPVYTVQLLPVVLFNLDIFKVVTLFVMYFILMDVVFFTVGY